MRSQILDLPIKICVKRIKLAIKLNHELCVALKNLRNHGFHSAVKVGGGAWIGAEIDDYSIGDEE